MLRPGTQDEFRFLRTARTHGEMGTGTDGGAMSNPYNRKAFILQKAYHASVVGSVVVDADIAEEVLCELKGECDMYDSRELDGKIIIEKIATQ